MAAKLKNLEVTKVDFVDAGANQQADILLYKNKDGQPANENKEDSKFKKFLTSIFSIAKKAGIEQSELESIAKGCEAETFDDKVKNKQLSKTTDEIWDFCYCLQSSLCSIVLDNDVALEDKSSLMIQSLNEFTSTVTSAISLWANGTPSKILKSDNNQMTTEQISYAKKRLEQLIEKSKSDEDIVPKIENNTEKGVDVDMKIDKSKLTPEEIAQLDAIEKKAGIPDETTPAKPVAKSTETEPSSDPTPATEGEEEDVYKGLHPAVAEELRALRKRADEAETRELTDIAKKYEIIGKKTDELVPLLKSLKTANNGSYEQMLSVLDATVETVNKSGAFTEIGKSGNGDTSDAWSQIEKHADDIQKSAPTMTRAAAITKACEQHPDLLKEYEESR